MKLNLYESERFANVTGPALRPGGLALTETMLKAMALPPRAHVLDAGCGQGATLAYLETAGYAAHGLDASAKLLAIAKKKAPGSVLTLGNAQNMPLPDNAFDAVLGECVLSLMDDPAAMLRECGRVLKPGGLMGLTDLYIREIRANAPACDFSNLTCCIKGAKQQFEIKALIENNGFKVTLFEDHTFLLKDLTAKLIFEYGSLQAFWDFFLGQNAAENMGACGYKYGYYMLVARGRT